jgi:hypothetical protein
MNENNPTRKFADELISQDAVVSEFQFEEFRMNLEKKLESVQHRARTVHRAEWIAAVVAIGCVLAFVPLAIFRLVPDYEWVGGIWGICTWTALIIAGSLGTLYRYKYRPAVDSAKSDLQTSIIKELQQQVATLIRQTHDQTKQ